MHARSVVLTREISIKTPVEVVWPWLAQLGRGAGFYSYDRLDNGGRRSAEHIVSWVPPPQLGDATAIGYLCRLDPGREMVWRLDDCRWLGTTWCGEFEYRIEPCDGGCRLAMRVSAEACGWKASPAMWLFTTIDLIMARRQLLGIKRRAEQFGTRDSDPSRPETGARDEYQWYEAIYASGERSGVSGKEEARRWRDSAIREGILTEERVSTTVPTNPTAK